MKWFGKVRGGEGQVISARCGHSTRHPHKRFHCIDAYNILWDLVVVLREGNCKFRYCTFCFFSTFLTNSVVLGVSTILLPFTTRAPYHSVPAITRHSYAISTIASQQNATPSEFFPEFSPTGNPHNWALTNFATCGSKVPRAAGTAVIPGVDTSTEVCKLSCLVCTLYQCRFPELGYIASLLGRDRELDGV